MNEVNNNQPEMNQAPTNNNKKSNNTLIICITIIIVAIVAGISVYFLTRPTDSNEPKSNNNGNSNNQTTETTNNTDNTKTTESTNNNKLNSNWINYLLNQDITSAEVVISDNIPEPSKVTKLDKSSLKELLLKLEDVSLIKSYEQGLGGPSEKELIVKYTKNGKNYEFRITYNLIFIDKEDSEIIKLFDNNNYKVDTTDKENDNSEYYYKGLPETLFDKYMK